MEFVSLLIRLKPQADGIIKKEQAGFRAIRNTTGQILSLRMLCEKYLQHQHHSSLIFVDLRRLSTEFVM